MQQTKTGVDLAATSSVPAPRFDTAVDPNSTLGTASATGASSGSATGTGNGTGRRVRTRNKAHPALVHAIANNGNVNVYGDKHTSENAEGHHKDKGFFMDLSEGEDGEDTDGGLGRKKRGEILGVLVA